MYSCRIPASSASCAAIDRLYRSTSFLFTTDLSAAVDVYSDWVDACDAVAKSKANTYDATDSQPMYSRNSAGREAVDLEAAQEDL